MNGDSYDVRFWKIGARQWKRRTSYRVRWTVAGQTFTETFATFELADAFRSKLKTQAKDGEPFDKETGLPRAVLRQRLDVTFLVHAREYAAYAQKRASAKNRISILETLARVVPVVTRGLPGAPAPDLLRQALRKHLNHGTHAGTLDADEARAIGWLQQASRPVSALNDDNLVCELLDALAVNLDGAPAAPEYFSRRRVLHAVLGYAVRRKRLEKNPVSKANLPEGWTPPPAPEVAIDPRCVGSPALIASMLAYCSYVGRRQGPRFAAFFACMYYAMSRPSEVAALTSAGCHLPQTGWGYRPSPIPARRLAARTAMTARSTSTAGSRAAITAGQPASGPAGPAEC